MILSQTLAFNPVPRLTVQGSLSYVNETLSSPMNAGSLDGTVYKNRVVDDEMDYYFASAMASWIVSNTMDMSVAYNVYFSRNGMDNSAATVPLGSDTLEQSLTGILTNRLTEKLAISVHGGIYSSFEGTKGEQADYTAVVVGTKLQYRF
jgi:hypothetical protein